MSSKYDLPNIVTIPNGVNFDEIDRLRKASIDFDGQFVIAIGRLVPLKQFDKLIEIYPKTKLYKQGIKLLIFGDGPEYDKLLKIIANKKLTSHIILKPFHKNIYSYIDKSRFLILSSQRESFGNVLVEALACEVPVVSFDCGGPREIVVHETNGLLVENQNFEALINAIDRMISDESLYKNCVANARQSIDKFDSNRIAKQWDQLFR